MAAIGICGVMAYSVSQRRSEIGIRMALGAEGGTLRWMIVSQGARMLAMGIGVGLVAAFLLSRLLDNLVFGISTTDPVTIIGVPVVLSVVAMVANLIPARRATGPRQDVTGRLGNTLHGSVTQGEAASVPERSWVDGACPNDEYGGSRARDTPGGLTAQARDHGRRWRTR